MSGTVIVSGCVRYSSPAMEVRPRSRASDAQRELAPQMGRRSLQAGKRTQRVLDSRYVPGDALPRTSNRFVKLEPSFNADDRGGVTCLHDTQLLGACLQASEASGRSRPEAVMGLLVLPITHPIGPPARWAAVGLVSPASFGLPIATSLSYPRD